MNFFSEEEVQEIITLAKPGMHLSQVGDVSAGIFKSNVSDDGLSRCS
jgi:hypothetical protein